jgi:hypothetical protein
MAPLIYLLAIGISVHSVPASLVLFILVPVYYIFPGRIDRHWRRDKLTGSTRPGSLPMEMLVSLVKRRLI